MARVPKTYTLESDVLLPRRLVWQLLSDTDHLNRVVGLLPVNYSAVAPQGFSVTRGAESRVSGMLAMRWQEQPFQWSREKNYRVTREYSTGPLRMADGGIELEDSATLLVDGTPATKLRVFAHILPRSGMIGLALGAYIKTQMRKTLAYCAQMVVAYEAGNGEVGSALHKPPVRERYVVNRPVLEAGLRTLEVVEQLRPMVPQLREHLLSRDDDQVLGMRPRLLARQWNVEAMDVLRLCLHATRAGLLNTSWNLMCPNCRVTKEQYTTLGSVSESFHCDLCGIAYRANFDRYVELRFDVHPHVRNAASAIYCIGGPSITPHIWEQRAVPAGESIQFEYPQSEERFRLRVLRANHVVELSEKANRDVRLTYQDGGWDTATVAVPMDGVVTLHNAARAEIVVALEAIAWDDMATTAAQVTAMQEFRDMFGSEVLAPGQQVGIESLTLLFSDLRESTQLYESIGDAPAYGQVRDHFDFMRHWIARHNGGIVKTIGDAVMAVFSCPEDAVRAALDIQAHVHEFNASQPHDESIVIKIGIHHGPAIVVNSNDRLDYFGRTVNIAARIQGASAGDDLVLSGECYASDGVAEALQEYSALLKCFEADLKGIAGTAQLYRAQVPRQSQPVPAQQPLKLG
ncbi:MAG TPA: adenylate/guanylate cyclase domain-containing protein [Abditibacteriaceae bacterium]|jgi:class 3 adenylate cyclase